MKSLMFAFAALFAAQTFAAEFKISVGPSIPTNGTSTMQALPSGCGSAKWRRALDR